MEVAKGALNHAQEAKLSQIPGAEQRYFDERNIPDDVWRVLRTASVLSIGEFRVFEIAYQQWFGEAGSEKQIERYFIPYMFQDRVPPWVRHFCKLVLDREATGRLDLHAFGLSPTKASNEQRWRGVEYLFWIAAVMIGMVVLADMATQFMSTKCVLPPCY